MKPVAAAALLTALAAGAVMAAVPSAPPVVNIASGQVSGVRHDGADVYLGIPYAQPPVGALRWKPLVKAAAWKGVRDGSKFATNCYQNPPGHFGPYADEFLISPPVSDDCLYLNVWTPAKRGAATPVIVWIHGGGFGSGSASIPIYDGSRLAAKGVVVVGINYRLGPFGFLASPELTAESPRKVSGNYGLLDTVEALRWVRANIARFGGDPARVTIMGQSAGAMAVNDLMLSPDAKGLFAGAISQSGSGGGVGGRSMSLAEAEAQGGVIVAKLGARSLTELRAASPDAILKAVAGPPPGSGLPPGPRLAPVVDGKVLSGDPVDAKAAVASKVPLLTGFNSDEVGLNGLDQKSTSEAFERSVRERYGASATRLLALYPHATEAEASRSVVELARDALFAGAVSWGAARADASGQKVYVYRFDHPYPVPNTTRWGAFHTAEVPYVFGVLDYPGRTFTPDDTRVAQQVQSRWIDFVTHGVPGPAGRSDWPAMGGAQLQLMELGDRPGVRPAASTAGRFAALREAAR